MMRSLLVTDVINAIIEAVPIVLIFFDVLAIKKDRQLKGARIWPKFYWVAYSAWCVYICFVVHLKYSGIMASLSTTIYVIYVALCVYYHFKNKKAWR